MKKLEKASTNMLRQNAEELLEKKKSAYSINTSETELLRLIHELEVHQIELELVNEDLNHARKVNQIIGEKYTELFDFAPIGVFVLSKGGQILELNLNGAKMLGKNRNQLKNSSLGFFVAEDFKSSFNMFLERIFKNEGFKEVCEIKIISADEVSHYVELTAIFLEKSSEFLVTMMDIDIRKQAEIMVQNKSHEIETRNEELTALNLFLDLANKKSGESDRLKSAFLANMSHEIRTPMNGILGFADLLKNIRLSSADQQEYIRIIEKSGVRMLNIINEIIDISKIESRQMFLFCAKTDLNEQLNFIHTFFHPEAKCKGIQLTYTTGLKGDLAVITTDKEKLYAILINLVKNAIKYTDEGSIEFGYVLKPNNGGYSLIKKPDYLEFYIKDSGIGIPKERQEAVFERFIQADIDDSRAFQGAGLGLTIAKSYVEMLGGRIWIVSDPACPSATKGSAFYFTIPYQHSNHEIPMLINLAREKDVTEGWPKLKILIAEDDEISNLFLREILKNYTKTILYATNGVQSVQLCQDNPDIDLVMMDIKMPVLDGYEATKQIRQFNKKVVIIAQTSFALKGDREKAIQAGCNDYITKPVNSKILQNMICQYF